MSLIFAGIMPNNPKMLEQSASETMKNALKDFVGELYCMKPDTIILFTHHGIDIPELLNVNIATPIHAGSRSISVDIALGAHIKEQSDIQQANQFITTIAQQKLAPEIIAPLTVLFEHLPKTRVLLIHTTDKMTLKEHFAFGDFLRSLLLATNERVALIAAGHLSSVERAEKLAYSSFDTLCVNFLTSGESQKILQINAAVQKESHTDIIQPLALFLGTIHTLNATPHLFLYEQSWNQGNIIVNFNFH